PSKTIQITYSIGATDFIEFRTTNGTGEIEFTKLLDKDNVTDIRQSFSIQFIALASEFFGAMITPGRLNADMAVNITSISVSVDVNNIFYTSGLDIDYTVIVQDEFGRNAPATDFILDFPGIGSQSRTTGGGGTSSLSSTIPVYILAQQTRNKTIVVTAQNVTGVSYRYVVSGTVNDTDTFNMYYTLTLDLRDFNNDIILDGNTTSIFNNTFWQAFSGGGFYNLTVVDQWTRNPVGATIYITFNGQTSQYTVTLTRNWVIFDYADLLASGLNSSEGQVGLTFVASGGDYTPAASITQTINIYGPDNNAPVIGAIVPTPNPNDPGIHDPYFNITFTIIATDVGTGIRFVLIHYTLYEPDLTPGITDVVTCFNIGGDNYQGTINMTYAQAQYYVAYYVEIIDYAGHGVDSVGNRQTNPGLHYDSAFGFSTVSSGDSYQIGDIAPPRQEQVPTVIPSANPLNPNVTIIIFTNDSLVYSGMFTVVLVVNITNIIANVMEEVNTNFIMTNNPGTNEWSYTLVMEYNYNYSWFYRAVDDATPFRNLYQSYIDYGFMTASAIDDVGPTISNLNVDFNGSIAQPDSLLNFTVLVTDLLVDVDNVTLIITYNGETLEFDMAKQGTTDNYIYILDLADYPLDDYGNFTLDYDVETYDTVGNLQSLGLSLMIYNAAPIIPPGGIGGNLGAIVGGAVGGIIALIAVLFLWFNRHTLQTYAKKQTFRRRLRDYLREIIEDIKRDGLEGRYKEGLLKTWLVLEGIGREFFELPRYRSQTPKEFARLLALKGKIERELIYTLLEYFEKARYGNEEITENDFNSGVRALLKIVDKIEVGEMEIES
ncbi:MAG: DUF4129 domain-containing protein, partial [Candidatus Heimdallarchaeota archaeon]|nr:DUF4129 domain-containing protein [Candidatus Heimdallarchaeota archaeon]MCK4954776.1 DUF4129 domain-containing protein [Candidatus Heimdallarchaeota archaeon]